MTSGLVVLLLCCAPVAVAQLPPDPDFVRQQLFPSYQDFKDALLGIVHNPDPAAREAQLDAFWTQLQAAGQVPYAQGNQYAYLYRGSAASVAWRGDFNGWGVSAGTQFAGTDLWIREGTLPADARVDYKLFLNGSSWVLDPANPLQMWSGFGPNSELRMPAYEYPLDTVRRPEVSRGTISENVTIASSHLGYDINYRVYSPAGYDAEGDQQLPVVYVTDGHEYAADHMGSMVVVLDNLIHELRLQPVMAVFIDPRQPGNPGNNRRASEYVANANFLRFVADELVPVIDRDYATTAVAEGRAILGTSLGGLNSAYFGAERGDVFQKIAIQSPAFSVWPEIYQRYATGSLQFLDIFMTAGTINDGNGGRTMAAILGDNGYDFDFTQANEGHSWGNWRAQLDDILVGLFGAPTLEVDFNSDGNVDGEDADALVAAIVGGTHQEPFDLTGDGRVDRLDLDLWLTAAGARNLPGGSPYLPGDANLDGAVDVEDFNTWNGAKFTHVAAWTRGDFNADGAVDASDYNIWNQHKFTSAHGGANVVPEPQSMGAAAMMLWLVTSWPRRGGSRVPRQNR